VDLLIQEERGVDQVRTDALSVGEEFLQGGPEIDPLRAIEALEEEVLQFQVGGQLFREGVGLDQVAGPDADAGDLAQLLLPHPVEDDVVREYDVGQFADLELGVVLQVVAGLELVDLREKHLRVHHHPVADHALLSGVKDSGRDQVEDEFLPTDHKRVPGVVPPGGTRNRVHELGVDVDNFSLALVTPLGAEDDDVLHRFASIPRTSNISQP
jgi:hypothetical protein